MKRKILLIGIFLILVLTHISCDNNSYAIIKVVNAGALKIYAQVQYQWSSLTIDPGKFAEFEVVWPGKDEMSVPVLTYPTVDPVQGKSQQVKLLDNDFKVVTVAYYLTK